MIRIKIYGDLLVIFPTSTIKDREIEAETQIERECVRERERRWCR